MGAAACAVSLVAVPVAALIATRVGLVDRPGPLKPQARPTPYLGGLGVGCGVVVGAVLLDSWLLIPFGIALVLGTSDDAWSLSPASRLLGQLAAGVALAAVVSTRLGAIGYVVVPLVTVAVVNGCNLIDGLDALCGSTVLVAAAGFAVLLLSDERGLALSIVGATAAFLVFNRPPAKVYLGDGGSYLLGLTLVALLAMAWAPGQARATGIGALALILLPVAEVVAAALRRSRSGRSLFAGDRDHPYDLLVQSGWSVTRTVAAYVLVELVLVALAIGASHLHAPVAWVLVGLAAVGLLVAAIRIGLPTPSSQPAGGVST